MLKTKVKISPLFFAVLTAFLITDRNGIAPVVIGFSLVHELCHFAALAAIKTAPQEVNVSAAGISMSLNGGMSTVKKILVLAAGAAGNFVLAAFFSAADNRLFFTVNLIIGIFTILPLCSTDGGSILTELAEKFFPERKNMQKHFFILRSNRSGNSCSSCCYKQKPIFAYCTLLCGYMFIKVLKKRLFICYTN